MPNPIRCSALPLAWACPESQNLPADEPRLNVSNEPAELGTAAHRFLAAHVQGTELDHAQLAAEHGCDPDELRMLCAQGIKALGKLREHFNAADGPMEVEVPLVCDLGEFTITGTADLLARQGGTALLADYKSGRVDKDHRHQLMGYARSVIRRFELQKRRIDDVMIMTIWLREGVWDIEKLTSAQVVSWAEEIGRRFKNGRGNFNPGAHCQYCARATSCEARRAMVRSTIADLSVDGLNVVPWTLANRAELAPQIVEMYGKVKVVEKAADDFREMLRGDIEEYGPLPIGGGRELALTPVNRRHLDPAKARPVLAKYLEPEELDTATDISLSACEKIAVAKARKGAGAGVKREINAALDGAGAISLNTVYQLREKKTELKEIQS